MRSISLCRRAAAPILDGKFLLALCVAALTLMAGPTKARAQDAAAIEMSRLEAIEKAGQRTSELGNAYHNLAIQLLNAGQGGRAEQPARHALAIWESVHGHDSGAVANACNTLAAILGSVRKDAESEHYARRALSIWEKEHGPDSGEAAVALNTLVGIMRTRGRWVDAEEPARRVLRIWTKTSGPDSDGAANASNTLSDVLQKEQKFEEAEKLARNALRIWQKLKGIDSEAADNARNTLAGALDGLGRKDEALLEQQRVLDSWTKRFGPNSGSVGLGANNLAWKQLGAGHVAEAEKLFQRTLEIWSEEDTRRGKQLTATAIPLSGLARTAMLQHDWDHAYDRAKQAVEIAIERTHIASTESEKTMATQAPSAIAQASGNLQLLIKAAQQLVGAEPSRRAALAHETYGYAQWSLGSQAADALAAMASRVAVGPALADVIRKRQDLEARWQAINHTLDADRNKPAGQRDKKADQALTAEANAIEDKLGQLRKLLNKDFAKYVALARIDPLTVEETQAQLNPDEALVLLLPTGGEPPLAEETFVYVITKNTADATWVRSELGTEALKREVAALRCGLDYAGAWFDDKGAWNGARCNGLLNLAYTQDDFEVLRKPLPFDLARAHDLYEALFGQVEDLIRDKHRLLIVPSGPLTQLPFQVLVTAPPTTALPDTAADYRDVAWLARQHAITVLPAVSSLKTLRELAKESYAGEPYIGFGNPLLDGDPANHKEDAVAARLARDKRCEPAAPQREASILGPRRGTRAIAGRIGGAVDVADLRTLAPLPETVDELCDVAYGLGLDPTTHLYLGAMATVTKIKQLSQDGSLAKYKIVHFATHGAIAGQISRAAEPGLILTPPDKPSAEDDGYLSASEVAGLKLDADWVILSACNTAAGGAQGAEALSGLARAFFYSGGRSLLVSHWEVASKPTVALITKAVAELKSDARIGRSEALRRSMVSMIETGKGYEAHPAFWAPFVLVGEGGAAR